MWPAVDTNTNRIHSPDSSDSDDDVLRAVLAFVESFDGGNQQDHSTVAKPATPSPRSRKRHSSERVRTEIDALRKLAVQLQDRVVQLQFDRARRSARASEPSAPSGWEIEAMRQEEQRLQSEVENLQLKALIEAQSTVGQRLEVLFERRVRHNGETTHDNASQQH